MKERKTDSSLDKSLRNPI